MDLSLLTHHNDQLLGCVFRKSHDTHPQVGGLSCVDVKQVVLVYMEIDGIYIGGHYGHPRYCHYVLCVMAALLPE